MINSKSGVFVTIINNNDYMLSMQKIKCDKPNDTYIIKLIHKFENSEVITNDFFMTEAELSYFARALVC
jgi:hypothetical protein